MIVVTDPEAVLLLGDLGTGEEPSGDPAVALAGVDVLPSDDASTVLAASGPAASRGREPLVAGLAAMLLAGGLGAAAATRRAIVARRRTRARIQARIDAFAAPSKADGSRLAGPARAARDRRSDHGLTPARGPEPAPNAPRTRPERDPRSGRTWHERVRHA